MEINNAAIVQNLPKQISTKTNLPLPAIEPAIKTSTSSSVQPEKKENISLADIEKAVEESNKVLSQRATGLEFSLDNDTGKTVVKLIDKATEEVLRQYPSKQMLAIAKELDRFQGSLVSEKV